MSDHIKFRFMEVIMYLTHENKVIVIMTSLVKLHF